MLSAEKGAMLEQVFATDGTLAHAIGDYRPRAQQLEMAQKIAAAIENNQALIAEAGTGTGKTFAYLVPSLLWGGKVIVSTGTKNLQDQLFERDLPRVRNALGAPVTVALLKGRANYLCHHYFERAQSEGQFASKRDVEHLKRIAWFAKITQTGDKAESGVPEDAPVWHQVTSTRENCLGQNCAHYKECFVFKARKDAQEADVVVVNHHLFFADLALRDGGVTELLPAANTIIFDEAHQLPDTATNFFGVTLTSGQLLDLLRDTLVEGRAHARDGADWTALTAPLEHAIREWRLHFGGGSGRWTQTAIPQPQTFSSVLTQVAEKLAALVQALESQAPRAESLALCYQRSLELQMLLTQWQDESEMEDEGAAEIRWVETTSHGVQLHRTPLNIAPLFSRHREGRPRAWIFTSATLAVRKNFSHYAQQLGLEEAQTGYWGSPFNYAEQAMLFVPPRMPVVHSPEFLPALFEAAWPLLQATKGGVFFLCTTLRAVDRIAELMQERYEVLNESEQRPVLIQGQASRNILLEKFRKAGNAILIGSQSFWEGVDVTGEALSLVIIDKLPFAPPDDPVLAARLQVLEKNGGNPFMDYQLPQAVITLKQGAGRLIRSETDRGVLMIGDTRLVEKPYGRLIWQSLPAFKRSREIEEVCTFLAGEKVD
ncbi:MAG: ATP-dependent DNA helicase [Burkholderiaceae bacterium]|nr:MAG: ATP-dependent DNA helicase [Burkholderiaceae bacterium]